MQTVYKPQTEMTVLSSFHSGNVLALTLDLKVLVPEIWVEDELPPQMFLYLLLCLDID